MATLKDVARETGLTVSTVSRVLNNRGYISKEAREKVYEAMKKLNYQPNEVARSLSKQTTNTIGVILPHIDHPYFSRLLSSLETAAYLNEYKLMVFNSNERDDKEVKYLEMCRGIRVAGIILCSGTVDVQRFEDLGVPLVTIERFLESGTAAIECDNRQGGRMVAKHLAEKGCRKVVYLSGENAEPMPADDRALGFAEDSVFANQTPLFFDAPLKELMPVIKLGATAYFVPKQLFSFPVPLCEFLNRHRVNTVCWVVSALTQISSLGALDSNPPRYLRTVAFGSEVFPPRQYRLWRRALPDASFFNLYGPTEATGMSCWWRADRELEEDEPIPVGRPFRNTGLLLIREDGAGAAPGETGEIYLRGTCVTLGYFNNPAKTAEAFVQNPLQSAYPEIVYRTGDLGYLNRYGELVFLGRRDRQIKHMGHRIELGDIEAAALRLESVRQAACVYDAEHKRILLGYTGSAGEAELGNWLKNQLPRYMLPALLRRLPAMPLTPNGKLDRRRLPQLMQAEVPGQH